MTGNQRTISIVVVVSVAVVGTWIARNTYWEDLKIPMAPKGEALVNPFYATQRFAATVGARTSWDRSLTVPPSNAVIVMSGWHWSVGRARRIALQQWVESGGRLVVDNQLIDPSGEFEEWSGIVEEYPEREADYDKALTEPRCRNVWEDFGETSNASTAREELSICDVGISWLQTDHAVEWALRDKAHIQAMRVRIGRGSVTAINAAPFRYRELFAGDHGRLFVAATQLRHGDEVHFLSEDDYPSLLALMWRHGAPAVAIGLTLLGFLLWRGAVRFGPLTPSTAPARRSLADQIRGSGRFALQHGGGQALHAACVRALDEAARRRISSYGALMPHGRSASLARVSGFDGDSLAAAIYHPRWRTSGELHRTLAFLEATRRETLMRHQKRNDGPR
jgi:hypothetical protein